MLNLEQIPFPSPNHTHECRNCKLGIDCILEDNECDFNGLCLYCDRMIAILGYEHAEKIAEESLRA